MVILRRKAINPSISNNLAGMSKSAGILAFRRRGKEIEFFLVHPGGPFWKGKDLGAWSIPKGEFGDEEEPLIAAQREFREETGHIVEGNFIELQPVRQKAGKIVYGWAVETDIDATTIVSNTFRTEYPYKSGKWITVPEVDETGWFTLPVAKEKINPAQAKLLDDLLEKLQQ